MRCQVINIITVCVEEAARHNGGLIHTG
jgi:hypothetical protein